MSDFYKCIETNERLVHYHSRKMQQLSAQLNKVRLSRRSAVTPRGSPMKQSFVEQLSNESCSQEKLASSPRSQMRPEHVQKLKSQLSGRKSIPVRSKSKVDTSTIIVNRKPRAVIEKSSFNRAEQEQIPKLQLEPESAPSTPDIRIQRDGSANVVSYMPAKPKTPQSFPTSSGPPNVEAPKTSFFGAFGAKGGENESKYNLNNPPQVINASTLPQAKGPSFAGAFSPAPHVNKGTQDAVRAALNTVNKIASEPSSVSSKLPEKEKTPHVSAFSVPQKAPAEKLKPTLAKEPTSVTTSKPNLFAPKTSSSTAPANVNPFGGTTANVFGSSKPDTSKSTFTFRNVVVSSSSEKDVSDGESGHISETDDESADDLEETIKVASTETVPKPNLFASAPKSGTGLFGSTATDPKAAPTKPSIFGAVTPKGPFGALSKAGGVGASGDRFTLDESAYDTPPRRPSKAKSPNVSGVNIFAGIQKEDTEADEKSTTEVTEESAASKPPSGLSTTAKTEEKKPAPSLFGSTPSKPAEDKDEKKETAPPSAEKPTIKNLFGTPAKQEEKPKPGLFGSSTSSGLFGSKSDDSKAKEAGSATGLFGSKPAEASSGSNLFGSKTEETKPTPFGSKAETSSSSSLFGSKPAESSSGTGLFGSTKKPESNLFGTPKAAEKTESGLFGSSKPAEKSSGSGLFGSSKPESSGGLFGSKPSESSNVFGTPAKSEANSGGGLFGSKPAESSSGLFGSSTPQSTSGFGNSGGGGGGLFGSSSTTSNSGGLFGSSNSNTNSSGGIFGSSNNDNNSGGGVFGSGGGFSGLGSKPDPEKAKQNPFGSSSFGNNSSSTNNSNLFGNAPANPFGSSTSSNQHSSSGPFSGGSGATSPFSGSGGGSSGGFGSSAFGSSGGNAFGSTAFGGGGSSAFGSSAFGSSNQQSSSFGSGNNSGGVFGGGSGGGAGGFGGFGGSNSSGGFGAKTSGGGGFGSFGGGNNQQQNNAFSGSGFSGFR
ncbi:Oidioi.mRNA.OKI2018_I69.XSR.g15930.t1.cds [Oikopleura dioica]|uniref:Oidioi.mRNA.OKI2018_I69.XSR.g15930.t1.cds n=1 Tax=Oikopleura dioica TaxID=34765 RepID=A0ABN7SEE8_OIKDI|nr:Oidioi.mRNA.OKI2018_I69.XSR.g15930.t1.cds [Oikopleura dioica]